MQEGESGRFTSFDGTGIAFDRWPGERGPVVLHHGFAADGRQNWVRPGIAAKLVDLGFGLVVVDARGHGRSDKSYDPADYGEPVMARDVSALADHLGLESWMQVGYSMGGIVSLFVAIEDPRVTRLVVGGIGAGVVELGGLDTRVVPRKAVAEALESEGDGAEISPAAARFRAFAESTGADRRALAACARAAFRERVALERITVPTLVVAGERDDLARRPEILAGAIAGARLTVVPGDHLGAVGEPALAQAITDFLEESP